LPRYIFDRLEAEYAVVEASDGRLLRIPRSILPLGAREGAVLVSDAEVANSASTVQFTIDQEATVERLAEARRLRERLSRGPEGDTSL
jgi:hypothetical protein